jgi:hypothetical protein
MARVETFCCREAMALAYILQQEPDETSDSADADFIRTIVMTGPQEERRLDWIKRGRGSAERVFI